MKFGIRNSKFEFGLAVGLSLLLQLPAFAKCPVSDGATLVLRAPMGNLHVDTTGGDAIDVSVSNNLIQIQENCAKDRVEISSNAPDANQIRGIVDWKIVVPKSVNLDLVAYAGSINVGDADGNAMLRTTGGSVVTGNIRGRAAIISQGGSIKAGHIGGDAELRSQGGPLEVGDVGGNADFQSARTIHAGIVTGRVNAETAGGVIVIKEARGDVKATTQAGDISVGDAARFTAETAGGNITSRRVRGPFKGHTESGDIRIDSAASWVEASTGFGNIIVKMTPENFDSDLHVNLQSGVGDVTIFLPARMKATVDATVEKPAFRAQRIISDFPMNNALAPNKFYAPTQSQTILNGGGNKIILHTSLGRIEIKKQ